jgi:hypothetical protein
MPRMSKTASASPSSDFASGLMGWAHQLGHAIGQGVARGLNGSLGHFGTQGVVGAIPAFGPKKRGRPAKPFVGFVAADRRCSVAGCGKPARAKGLCSAHYQASRRKKMAKA